jgi:hypothetical protein
MLQEKSMLKPVSIAVEGLLADPEPILAPLWRARYGPQRKEGWAFLHDTPVPERTLASEADGSLKEKVATSFRAETGTRLRCC